MSSRRNFWLLWSGQFISSIGDHMFYAVLIFLVITIETSHSGTKAGIVSFMETLPFLIFGPFAGAIVDKFKRRYIMMFSDIMRLVVLLSFWPFYYSGLLRWWTIGSLAFLHTSFSSLFLPARDALLPSLAGGWLFRANALLQTSTQLAMVLGAVSAGLLVGSASTVPRMLLVLTVDALTFLVSFLTLLNIRVEEPPLGGRDILRESLEGFYFVKRDVFLRRLLVLTALDNLFIMGPAFVGANLLIKRVFGLGASHLAFFEASMALGWFIGTLYLYMKSSPRMWLILVLGIIFDGATYIPFLFVRNYHLSLLFIAFHGFFIPWIVVSRTTLLQKYVTPNMRGRVFAFVHLTVLGFTALSSFITGILADLIPVQYVFFLPGVMGTLTGLVALKNLPEPKIQ